MDVGPDVRGKRGASKAVAKLANTVQGMMDQWTEENFGAFKETMDLIREGAPVQWVKLYMEAVKLGVVKESNINININRQQDREALQGLVRARLTLPDNGNYTPYEEVRPKELIVEKPEEEK